MLSINKGKLWFSEKTNSPNNTNSKDMKTIKSIPHIKIQQARKVLTIFFLIQFNVVSWQKKAIALKKRAKENQFHKIESDKKNAS
jgi:hypothetical protein